MEFKQCETLNKAILHLEEDWIFLQLRAFRAQFIKENKQNSRNYTYKRKNLDT